MYPLHRLVLKDFDKDFLVESRAGRFHRNIWPSLTSFRGQIFVYGRHPDSGVGFSGFYSKNFSKYLLFSNCC